MLEANVMSWMRFNRGYNRTLVYFPGWATDYRLLDIQKLTWDVVAPSGLLTRLSDLDSLPECLKELNSYALLGWSMGAMHALEFARLQAEKVEKIFIASVSPKWSPEMISALKAALAVSKNRALASFYQQCYFPTQMEQYREFKQILGKQFARDFDVRDLLDGLEFLETYSLSPSLIPSLPLTVIHGANDAIAPISDITEFFADSDKQIEIMPAISHVSICAERLFEIINAHSSSAQG